MKFFKRWMIKLKYRKLYKKFSEYTMIGERRYIRNLLLIKKFGNINGSVVECGTWRGGMIAGTACVLGNNRCYYLYDSFEGLPDAKPVDGKKALNWQANKESENYYNNCTADEEDAKHAMTRSGADSVVIKKGWFSQTLPSYDGGEIAVLRLDGDWYESTMDCLNYLFPKVTEGGLIIIDDYYTYAGCSRAVHDYLAQHKRTEKIRQYAEEIAYIVKNSDDDI